MKIQDIPCPSATAVHLNSENFINPNGTQVCQYGRPSKRYNHLKLHSTTLRVTYRQVWAIVYTFNISRTREVLAELLNMSSSRERYLERAKTLTEQAPVELSYIMGSTNITTWEDRGTGGISPNEESQLGDIFHNLNIAPDESWILRIHNSVLYNRANFFMIAEQQHFEAFYCLPLATVTKVEWDIYLHILELPTIIAILASVAAFGFLQNDSKIESALSLASLMIGTQCCLKRPKNCWQSTWYALCF